MLINSAINCFMFYYPHTTIILTLMLKNTLFFQPRDITFDSTLTYR